MIRTPLTDLFALDYPIVLGPMGGASGAELAAAVSNAGGLGLIGGAYGNPKFLMSELDSIQSRTSRKWGVGLITWKATDDSVELALSYKPDVFFLSFGDPRRFASRIKSAGCALICQVQDVEGAIEAKAAGADFIVAQGTEAGGHGGARSTLPLIPAVMDAVSPIPVLAAGGIADGRGLAAALAMGAAGAVIGTRFCATKEALIRPAAKDRIVRAKAGDTVRTRVFDDVAGLDWPAEFTGRALRNKFFETGEATREVYRAAQQSGDYDTAVIWAGEVVESISDIRSASDLVAEIGKSAEQHLRKVAGILMDRAADERR